MPSEPHISVLEREALELLDPQPGGTYVDVTVGAGGHSFAIASKLGGQGRLIAFDRDPEARATAARRLAEFDNVTIARGRLGELAANLKAIGFAEVDGIFADLGVSSMQLDDPGRGFSFGSSGPIDMRMGTDEDATPTALELIRQTATDDLAAILRNYGEERYSRRIADRLRRDVRAGLLTTTAELAKAITEEIPEKSRRHLRIHPATRTFQALRIAVNAELDELSAFLASFSTLLRPGGRCVVISFHSLEDRQVKRAFRELAQSSSLPRDLAIASGERPDPICELLTRKPVVPDDDEIARNPRARSAKLRACRKL